MRIAPAIAWCGLLETSAGECSCLVSETRLGQMVDGAPDARQPGEPIFLCGARRGSRKCDRRDAPTMTRSLDALANDFSRAATSAQRHGRRTSKISSRVAILVRESSNRASHVWRGRSSNPEIFFRTPKLSDEAPPGRAARSGIRLLFIRP